MPRRSYIVYDTSGRNEYPAEARQALAGLNVQLQSRAAPEGSDWMAECSDADALLVTGARITAAVLAALPRLRAVVRYGVGLDRIDLVAARERGVEVRNVRDFCIDELADHTIGLLLALSRDLAAADQRVRRGAWELGPRKLYRLRGQTLGLVGLGAIGRAVAQRAAAFGLERLAYDPFANQDGTASGIRLTADLDELLEQSDWISLHCPLTPQTAGLIDAAAFSRMKPGAGLINTARGEIVVADALVSALDSGHLAAAGLDVLEQEPPLPENPLLRQPNVILTPHSAWYSETACRDVEIGAFRQLADVLRNLPPAPA